MSTRKLLLADDSITIQKVVNLTFADEGIEVITVGDGNAAIEKLSEVTPDLVMADINMPGLNGYQVCEHIKQSENFRQTPVILLVGSFEPFDEAEAKRVGADDFLTKPFQSIRQLVSKVTVLLNPTEKGDEPSYENTANNSLADTLEMEKQDIVESDDSGSFGDAGMDDEMIQANHLNSFALDESIKFKTKETEEAAEDLGKTQPLSVYDLKEFSFVASPETESQVSETTTESETETGSDREDIKNLEQNESENGYSSLIDSSEDDLLEIPFDEENEWEEEEEAVSEEPQTAESEVYEEPVQEREETVSEFSETGYETANTDFENNSETGYEQPQEYHHENEIVVGSLTEPEREEKRVEETAEAEETSEHSPQFPPELIEAVAQRVIEKLSDTTVREIAWEVVPQHADLIIRKMVEEKLKQQ